MPIFRRRHAVALTFFTVLAACSGHHTVLAPTNSPAPGTAATTTTTAVSPSNPGTTTIPPASARHVMIIILENREASQVIGAASAPAINALATQYGEATQAYATTHPSLPNYLELISGSTHGIASDCTTCSVEGQTIADQLTKAGIGWRAYMEGISSPCPSADGGNGYAKKHDPFVYFRHIVQTPGLCDNVVSLGELNHDLAGGAPPFMWVTPSLCHDGHDCSTAVMDSWVDQTMRTVMASPWYAAGGTVILTFDEGTSSSGCCGGAQGGHIALVVVRHGLGPGARLTTPLDQAGILGSIEDVYGLGRLGDATCSCSGSLTPLLGS